MANLFELAAKLTLDSSDYEKGIEAAKQAAANFAKGLTAIVTATQNADKVVNAAADSAENLGQSAAATTNGVGNLSDTVESVIQAIRQSSDSMEDAADSAENLSSSANEAAESVENVEDSATNTSQKMGLLDRTIGTLADGFNGLRQAGETVKKGFDTVHSAVDTVKTKFQSLTDGAKSLVDGGLSKVQSGIDNVRGKFSPLTSAAQNLIGVFSRTSDAAEENADAMEEGSKSADTLKNRIAMLQGVYDAAKAKVERLTDEFNKSAEETGATSDETKALARELDRAEREMNDAEKALKQYADRTDDAEKETRQLGDAQNDTSKKTSRFGDIVKGVLTADVIKTGLSALWSGVKKVGQVFIDIGKSAVDAYGNYEQLAGGIKKLYGDASKEVMNNAKQAYLTSGMSANQYMEQSTKFSAALINSLGGDTKEAARLTDVAMRSIADNFNTFGTDIESVQNAFQGFAKGNYMMLDNLSLGYGGTEKEMKRLISDANKYAKTIGETSNLSIDSFADIVKAIELVQKKQGIYETTSKEAATTIQGSLNMTKAAWENLLVGIADDSADFDTLINNLVESATAAGKNLIPRVEQVIKGIGRAIEKLLPIALEEAPKAIARYAPEVLESVKSLFSVIYNSLQNLLTETDWNALGGKISDSINNIDWATLFSYWAQNFGAQLVATLNLLSGFIENVDWYKLGEDIINSVLAMVENIDWGAVISKTFELLGAALGGLQSLADGLAQAAWDAIKSGFEATKDYFNKYIEDAGGNIIEGLFNGIKDALKSIGSWIYNNIFKPFIDGFKNAFGIHSPSTVMQTIGKFIVEGLINPIKEIPSKVWNFFVSTVQKAIQFGNEMRSKAIEAARTFKDNIVNGLKNLPSKMAEIGTNVVKGIWNGIKNVKDWILNKIKGFGKGILDGLKKALGIASPSKFTAEDGKFLVQGLAKGILDNAADAKKAAAKLSNDVLSAFNSDGLAMAVSDLPDLNTDISTSLTATGAATNEESNTDKLLMMILETLTQLDDGMKDKIKSAVDGMGFNWNDRELGRLVKTYA